MDKSDILEKHKLLAQKLEEAQVVLVGIGEEFNENFEDIDKLPMLQSALEHIEANPELEWIIPFLEKYYIESNGKGRSIEAYGKLYELIREKDYFIVTTCIDGNIEKADFDKERIVEPCGSYKLLQCSEKCSAALFPAESFAGLTGHVLSNEELDAAKRPVCPSCGRPLVFNNILCENNYVEEGYKPQWEKYTGWLQRTLNKKICVLELGVGMNMPGIIRWPFEKVAFYNEKAAFFRINGTLHHMTKELEEKGVSVGVNAVDFLNGYKV
ncbi:MAG: hypothetical protein LUE96_06115 [Lachnospiraceae bacterium]|nr:hypothetical protein [Lachnospiraceae bacterium]